MALPEQTASILVKTALGDLALGVVLLLVGLTAGPTVLALVGAALAVVGGGMFTFARSQRPRPDGPIEGGPLGGGPIS